MVKLFCAVIGKECVITIDIDPQQVIGDLKEQIKRQEMYGFPSSTLTLYLAKQNGYRNCTWVTTASPSPHSDYALLLRGDEIAISTYLTTELLLDPTRSVEDNFTGAPQKKVIHVLVKLPNIVPVEKSPLLGHDMTKTTNYSAIAQDSVGIQENL